MKAIVLATRAGQALAPLTEITCVALLPVAGKSLLEHTIESLVTAGIREALVVISPRADLVERALGSGMRWGMTLDYVLIQGHERTDAVVARLRPRVRGEFLVVRGDVLRSPAIGVFLERAATIQTPSVAATIAGAPAGLRLVRETSADPLGLPDDPESPEGWREDAPSVELPGAAVSLIESLAAYHRANLDAAAGLFPGLILPGRRVGSSCMVGRGSSMPLAAVEAAPVFVGSRCRVHPSAQLARAVVSDDVVIDREATVRSTVILPHTYVGELVELENAIVASNILIRVDTGAVARVTDTFLLADVRSDTLGMALGNGLNRLLGLALLVLSLPLWPLALLVSLASSPARPFRRLRLLGNRPRIDERGERRPAEFTAVEAACPVPVLRGLPLLFSVIRGDLRVVGVTPLSPGEAKDRTEEWERVRDESPVGLIGPVSLALPPGAPLEERRMMEAYYARSRTTRGDLGWLVRGAAALFTARAWTGRPT